MSKSLTASKKVMKNYLSELLTDPDLIDDSNKSPIRKPVAVKPIMNKPLALKSNENQKSLETLLKQVSDPKPKVTVENKVIISPEAPVVAAEKITTEKSRAKTQVLPKKAYRQGDFQAMFFEVAGLIIAVPLIELGGIHKVDKINSLMGKPDWYKGVMINREEKINVVDTALWVMPEKCDETLRNSLNYQYIIMLNDSSWGLMAEKLIDTVVLSQDEVKWLDSTNKRPWLAGLVKEKMCALLDVNSLIKLLDQGSGIHQ